MFVQGEMSLSHGLLLVVYERSEGCEGRGVYG